MERFLHEQETFKTMQSEVVGGRQEALLRPFGSHQGGCHFPESKRKAMRSWEGGDCKGHEPSFADTERVVAVTKLCPHTLPSWAKTQYSE